MDKMSNQEKKQTTIIKNGEKKTWRAITLQVAIEQRHKIGSDQQFDSEPRIISDLWCTNIIFVDIPELGSGNILLDPPCYMILMLNFSICCH